MPAPAGRWSRARGPLALLVLAPFFGEYVTGSLTVRELPAIGFLVPLYGGGALLVREVARRCPSGWPAVLVLGLCFGVVTAGVVDGSLFDAHYEGMDLTAVRVPGLGVSAVFGPAFVVNHALVSIAVPVAVAEAFAPAALRTAPWSGTLGLAAIALLWVGGALLIWSDQSGSRPAPGPVLGAAVVAVALVVLARMLPPVAPEAVGEDRRRPSPWALGAGALIAYLLWANVPATWWGAALGMAILAAAAGLGVRLARGGSWTPLVRACVVAGVGLGAAATSFQVGAFTGADDPGATAGRALVALLALAVLAAQLRSALRPARRRPGTPRP